MILMKKFGFSGSPSGCARRDRIIWCPPLSTQCLMEDEYSWEALDQAVLPHMGVVRHVCLYLQFIRKVHLDLDQCSCEKTSGNNLWLAVSFMHKIYHSTENGSHLDLDQCSCEKASGNNLWLAVSFMHKIYHFTENGSPN